MTDITIPTEALEAAVPRVASTLRRLVEPDTRAHDLTEDEVAEIALSACLAILKHWPGMQHDPGALVTSAYRDGAQSAEATIAALRAENERLLAANKDLMLHFDGLRADYEKLRAALELFACDCEGKELCAQPSHCVNYIARAALGDE